MQRIFSTLKQAVRKSILILAMILLTLSGSFIFVEQPSLAARPISSEGQKMIQQEKLDKQSQVANDNEQAYEEEVKEEKNPEKVYEENVKASKKANPGEGLVEKTIEGAGNLVDKVTGKK